MRFTQRIIFYTLIIIAAIAGLILLYTINDKITFEVPAHGGEIREGIVGFPRFINPVLAVSDADKDLVALVYSGLMKAHPEKGLIPDLAESLDISEDGLTYTFTLRGDALFHDGTSVTADDVIFTINRTQDGIIKSPQRPNWDGIVVSKVDDKTVSFTLAQPYAPFIENTTLGILPKHIWGAIDSEQFSVSPLNTEPIGSGPYTIKNIKRDSAGIPSSYILESFSQYTLGEPYIAELILSFYSNEEMLLESLSKKEIQSVNSINPAFASGLSEEGFMIETQPLSRIFAIFFNQNNVSALTSTAVRDALNVAIDKERIVEEVLLGYGHIIDSPLPAGILKNPAQSDPVENRIEEARSLLSSAGWDYNAETGFVEKDDLPLSFSISTSNAPELKQAAQVIASMWQEVGVNVEVKVFDIGILNQEVIRPREYEGLLFGQVLGRDLDLYAFWHSSQRNDPGLNIALYANIQSDALLQKLRETRNAQDRQRIYEEFKVEIDNDIPAVFLYSPDFIYVIPDTIQGFSFGTITVPAQRFISVHEWYIHTEKVWEIFRKD